MYMYGKNGVSMFWYFFKSLKVISIIVIGSVID